MSNAYSTAYHIGRIQNQVEGGRYLQFFPPFPKPAGQFPLDNFPSADQQRNILQILGRHSFHGSQGRVCPNQYAPEIFFPHPAKSIFSHVDRLGQKTHVQDTHIQPFFHIIGIGAENAKRHLWIKRAE